MKVRVARSAKADLDEIWFYIAKKASVETAERYINFLASKLSFLALTPKAGRLRPELGLGVRSFSVQNYRIYYREEKRGVLILYVRHAKRSEEKLLP